MSKNPTKPTPARKRRVDSPTSEAIAQALRNTGGNLAAAARALKTTRGTIYDRMQAEPDLRVVYDEENEGGLDAAEAGLAQFMRGDVEGQRTAEQLDAIKFYLRTKGRSRGYGDRVDVHTHPLKPEDVARLSEEELASLAAGVVPPRLATQPGAQA